MHAVQIRTCLTKKLPDYLPKWLCHFVFSPKINESFVTPYPFQNLKLPSVLDFCLLYRYVSISIPKWLMLLSIFSYAYFPSAYLFEMVSVWVFYLRFDWIVHFPIGEFYGFFEYFGYQSPSLGLSFANVFSSLWLVVILWQWLLQSKNCILMKLSLLIFFSWYMSLMCIWKIIISKVT